MEPNLNPDPLDQAAESQEDEAIIEELMLNFLESLAIERSASWRSAKSQ